MIQFIVAGYNEASTGKADTLTFLVEQKGVMQSNGTDFNPNWLFLKMAAILYELEELFNQDLTDDILFLLMSTCCR